MTASSAREALDAVIVSRPQDEPLNVLLMGGEPFVAFPLIKDVVDYTLTRYPSKNVMFKAVTNGTLVHGEIQDWLIARRDVFEVTLSLDGDRETHNRNRCNSYDKIDFDFFTRRYGRRVTVSSVVVPETLDHLCENVVSMEDMGFGIKYALADGIEWDEDKDTKMLSEQLDALTEHYLAKADLPPMNLLSYAIWCVPGNFKPERCIPGVFSHCIVPDGGTYACHRATPYYNNGKWAIPQEKTSLKGIGFLKEECSHCCVRSICNACPATVASIQSDPDQVRITCALNRVLYRANAKMVLRMFLECPQHIHLTKRPPAMRLDMLEVAKTILAEL